MRRWFKWIEWNLDKIAAHGLSYEDVEYAFEHCLGVHQERDDGSYETIGSTPSGRRILVVWRYDEDARQEAEAFELVFVLRVRARITSHFGLPGSRHLRPLLNREFLDVLAIRLRIRSIVVAESGAIQGPKTTTYSCADPYRVLKWRKEHP